jgi:hypothetical protein
MDKDRIAGSAKDFAGKVDGTVGDAGADGRPRPRAAGLRPGRMLRAKRQMPPSTRQRRV